MQEKHRKTRTKHGYPFSHNHGNGESPYINERKLILEGPIFHFHDYGRKGKHLSSKQKDFNLGKMSVEVMADDLTRSDLRFAVDAGCLPSLCLKFSSPPPMLPCERYKQKIPIMGTDVHDPHPPKNHVLFAHIRDCTRSWLERSGETSIICVFIFFSILIIKTWSVRPICNLRGQSVSSKCLPAGHSVDGRNPAPPVIDENLWKMGCSPDQLVQDFFHQQY